MKKAVLFILIILTMSGLAACSSGGKELPAPQSVYAEIESSVELNEMVKMTAEETEDYIGIEPSDYSDFAYYTCLNAVLPDEIAIFTAADNDAADRIKERLQNRLDYKAKSAENYLPENLPIINEGVIRQDGLTISLIVSEQLDEIAAVYKKLGGK